MRTVRPPAGIRSRMIAASSRRSSASVSTIRMRGFFADPHAPWQRATNENTAGVRSSLCRGWRSRGLGAGRAPQPASRPNSMLIRALPVPAPHGTEPGRRAVDQLPCAPARLPP
ncbi:hypothetical protein FHW79_002071 [Azospirillum sp. OGB3]|nr:hypothetical protein [Azospirillum sp. OGB3]